MSTFLSGFIIFSLLCTVNLLVIALIAIARVFPAVLPFFARLIGALLFMSRHLHVRLITGAAPTIKRATGIDLETGLYRLAASCALSVLIGSLLLAVLGFEPSIWTLLVAFVHGLYVDLTWQGDGQNAEIDMGERIPWNR